MDGSVRMTFYRKMMETKEYGIAEIVIIALNHLENILNTKMLEKILQKINFIIHQAEIFL